VWTLARFDHPDLSLLKGFDFIGLVLMGLFLGSLEFVVEEGPRKDWLEDRLIVFFAAVSVAAGLLFFWRMLRYSRPIVDLRAYADRNFAIGSLYSFVIGIGLYGSIYLLPLFLARVRGYNSLQIGTLMMVTGGAQFLTAPIAGMLSKHLGLRAMLTIGLTVLGLAIYLNSFLTAESGFAELFLPQALRGASLMFCFIPINTLALGTLPAEKVKNASGLYNLMRNLGGAIGLAVINTVLIERVALHQDRLADWINPARPAVTAWLDTVAAAMDGRVGDPERVALAIAGSIVGREALVLTFSDCLLLMAAVVFGSLLLMPLVRKPGPPA
jgi:DHA2 family multidrug resistance protein